MNLCTSQYLTTSQSNHDILQEEADQMMAGFFSYLIVLDVLEFPLDLFDNISLDNVSDLDFVVSLDIETAVHS